MKLIRAIARMTSATAVLAALLGGVPLALLRWADWPLDGVPTWAEIKDIPTSVASDGAVLGIIVVALWLAWGVFALSVLAEVVAQVRGAGRPHMQLGGPLQRLAGYLVGSVLVGVGPLSPVVAAAMPSSADAAAVVVEPIAVSAPGDLAARGPTITVARGDNPWSLAEAHLGDGMRWREIWELNQSRAQSDGGVWSDARAALEPGWELVLPADGMDAVEPLVVAAPLVVAEPVVVQPGDNFWELAEDELTSAWGRAPSDAEVAPYWRNYVEGNRDALLPPEDPNLIYPGQTFTVPGTPADPAAPPPPVEPSPPAPPVADDPADPVPPPSPPTTEQPDDEQSNGLPTSPSTTSSSTSTSTSTSTSSSTTEAPDDEQPDDDSSVGLPVPTPTTATTGPPRPDGSSESSDTTDRSGPDDQPMKPIKHTEDGAMQPLHLVGGGLALAGVVVLLDRRRRAQLRRRARGAQIPLPPPPLQPDERMLRSTAGVDSATMVDVALRAAAAGSQSTGLPPLRWVEASAGGVLLVLAAPAPAPPGFAPMADDRWVTTLGVDGLVALGRSVSAPAPTLIPVGTTATGTELLVDLESSGVITISGPTQKTIGLLRAMAVSVATSAWSEQARVVVVGMRGELIDLPWVTAAPDLSGALVEAEDHAERTVLALRSLRCPTTAQARASGATPESWQPLVVLSAVRPGMGEQHVLQEIADWPHSAVAVVVPAPSVGETDLGGRRFMVGEDGWLRIDGVDEPVQPRYLDQEDAHVLMALLDVASQPPLPPPPPRPPAPAPPVPEAAVPEATVEVGAEPEPEPVAVSRRRLDTLMEEVDVLVRVLGEVEAVRCTDPDGPEERLVPSRQKGLEAIAYLALREAAVDREDLEINLFPDGANAAKTVYNTISAARVLVTEELFPPPEGGRYELSERVVSDYGLFCDLIGQADELADPAAAAELLADALGLVRGEPFTGVGRGYAWVGPHRGMIVAQVVDTAEELAEIRLATGDWRGAEWSARQGLRAFPSDERMYRLLMRTAHAAGNIPGVQRVFRELCDVIADPDDGVEPEDTLHDETVTLLEELTGTASRQRRPA